MAKKKKPPEHENLERWLVSYSDFMTLIFATFVVLYALSQMDINDFKALEQSLRQSFSSGIIEGSNGIMNQSESMVGDFDSDSMIMMEYMSQKYEEESFSKIKEEIEKLSKSDREFENISVEIDERGLVIKFTDKEMMFKPGSAQLQPVAQKYLKAVGKIIQNKFRIHLMRVEGHTDPDPIRSSIYPTNWELSSARASAVIRYLVKTFDFQPILFSAVGLAEHRPIADNGSDKGKAKNRRVEIIILKNKYKKIELGNIDAINHKLLEIEHIKVKNTVTTPKNYADASITIIPDEEINFVPQDRIIELNNTYKKEESRLDQIRKRNQKLFTQGK